MGNLPEGEILDHSPLMPSHSLSPLQFRNPVHDDSKRQQGQTEKTPEVAPPPSKDPKK